MSPQFFHDFALVPALQLLPRRMDSPGARAMVIAINLQESSLEHRRQVGGPARGFAQFERGGLYGVLTHAASQSHARALLAALDYDPLLSVVACHNALEHNDVLDAGLTRLLLWTLPGPVAKEHEAEHGWDDYIEAWRPGRPHRLTWDSFFAAGWGVVA